MSSYNNMQHFKRDCAWVIFDQGEVHLYGPDGQEISRVKNISLTIDADSYPDVKANFLVNVGTLEEMHKWIETSKEPEPKFERPTVDTSTNAKRTGA